MVSRTRKLHDVNGAYLHSANDARFLRDIDKGINPDAQLFENLAGSKAEIQKIMQCFGSKLEWRDVRSRLDNENFVGFMLKSIGKLALHDLNCMMESATGSGRIELKSDEFGIETYTPEGAHSEYELGKYDKNRKKCGINLALFTKIFLKPKEGQPTTINEKQLTGFLEAMYSTMIHEGFHAVQYNRLDYKGHIKNSLDADTNSIFTEGGARFVEFFAESLITAGRYTSLNGNNSLEKAFLWHFAIEEPVSYAVYEEHDKIIGTLKKFIPHNAGMFIFTVRYVANESFIKTLNEICKMAERGSTGNEELYRVLSTDIENGNVEKLKQRINIEYLRN